ncbi:MAG: M56 family metallopeptidase [Armatimonas sp.]
MPSPILVPGTILLLQEPDASDRLLVAHELAHLRRGDLAWEWIGVLTQTIFWFHPLVWLARREERLAREEAADALALLAAAAPPADYARALLEASLKRSGSTPLLGVGVFEKGSRLRRRLEAIAQPCLPRRKLLLLGVFAAVVASMAFVPWRAVARQRPVSQSHPTATTPADPVLPLRGVMSGLVLSPSGKPVSGAEIAWVVPYSPKPVILAKTTTDTRGEFVFKQVPGPATAEPLQQRWRRNLDGWVMVKASGLGMSVRRVRFENRAFTVRLSPPQTYTASFRDAAGKPVVGLSVWCNGLANKHKFFPLKWLGYVGKTDARGEFRVAGMPQNDKIWFEFDKSRWREVQREDSEDETHSAFTLDTGYTVEGYLRNPDGRPVTHTWITTRLHRQVDTYSNAQGYFKLEGMEAGQTPLEIQLNRTGDFVAPHKILVSIPTSQRVVRHDITLIPAAKIIGRVTDTQGNPLKSLTIRSGGNLGYTYPDGHYELSVPEGEVRVSVENRPAKTVRTTRGKPTTLDFRFSPMDFTTITGEVLDKRGEPASGISLDIGREGSAVTDNQGRFRWQSQGTETGKIAVFAHQGSEGAFAEVAPGGEKRLTLRLSEKGVGHLTGRVTDAAGKPIRNVSLSVSLKTRPSTMMQRNQLDSQGNFRIPVPPGAQCRMNLQAKGYGLRSLPTLSFSAKNWNGIALNGAETKELGQIMLRRGDATLTGKLLTPAGKIASQATVILFVGDSLWSERTDTTGHFAIPGVVKSASGILMVLSTQGHWVRKNVATGDLGTVRLSDKDSETKLPGT